MQFNKMIKTKKYRVHKLTQSLLNKFKYNIELRDQRLHGTTIQPCMMEFARLLNC